VRRALSHLQEKGIVESTQGRGSFHMEMDHYDIVPQQIAEKLVAGAKHQLQEEEEA